MGFIELFEQLCEERNIKPTPLLKELNISASSLQKWKNGSNINSGNLIKIADYFSVSTDYLLGRTEPSGSNIVNNNNTISGTQAYNYNAAGSDGAELNGIQRELIEAIKDLPKSRQSEILAEVYRMVEK